MNLSSYSLNNQTLNFGNYNYLNESKLLQVAIAGNMNGTLQINAI